MRERSVGRVAVVGSVMVAWGLLAAGGPASAAEKIRYSMNWVPEGEHCGFYQAKAAGLYDKAGLDVDLKEGGPDVNVSLLVSTDQLELGMGDSFTTINMVAQNIPGLTVAAMFQKDPQTLLAHPGQGVEKLPDVKGKPVMIAKFAQQGFWQFLKQKYGFTDDQLRPYAYSPAPFLADEKAIEQGYVTEDEFQLTPHMKGPPVIMLLADYGYQNYATTIFGKKPWIDAHKPAVAAFIKATAEGYKECLDGSAAEGIKLLHKANPDESDALTAFKLKQMKDREMVTGGDAAKLGIGAMTDARFKDFFDTMSASGVYKPDLDYKSSYTLEFVGK
jgi:NitT/TauT family transport system substrate-binding protein